MPKSKDYYKDLEKLSKKEGADLFGVADVEAVKKDFLISPELSKKINKAVCLGLGLSRAVLQDVVDAPTRLYFHHYRTVNAALDQMSLRVCRFIEQKGYLAIPIPASQIVDWQNQKAHLSHKKIAQLAGIGWIGRNNLLVSKKFGSQFRLATILTDMPLKTRKTVQQDCGNCRLCIEVCPAQAIKESPAEFDHLKCFDKLKEFQKKRLVDQYICGLCVRVCRPK